MNSELFKWEQLPTATQHIVAEQVALYTQGKLGETPQMLPVTCADVFAKFAGLVALQDGALSGYVGAGQPMTHAGTAMSEIGSLWVPKAFRGEGIAHALVQTISEQIHQSDMVPYAFCNPLSLPVFLASGFDLAAPDALPVDAFSFCVTCPMKPSTGCCDTTVVYTGNIV